MRATAWMGVAVVLVLGTGDGWAQTAERAAVDAAAEALGGRDQLMALQSLRIVGYGRVAHQDGGGRVGSSPHAPMKWININAHQRFIDPVNRRMNVQERRVQNFVHAFERNMVGANRVNQSLDGDVAFNIGSNGEAVRAPQSEVRERRIDMLNNPAMIVRTALDASTQLTNVRLEEGLRLIDLTTREGDELTLALDPATDLPAWLSWVGPHTNYGDLTHWTHYTGYQPVDGEGLLLPSGYRTVLDFRGIVQQELYVDKYDVNAPAESLAAPAGALAAAAPVPGPRSVDVVPVGQGVWFIRALPNGNGNSTLFEFEDHLVLFEAYGGEPNFMAILEAARATVPGKPVTQLIVSHHHNDHAGGLRTAVSEGLTIITNRQNVELFRELTARPATRFPDALGRNPGPLSIIPVDDHLELKDDTMEVDVYRVVNNSHMANALVAHVPQGGLLAQGDLVDERWDLVWWGNSYPETVEFWGLDVAQDLAVHGNINTYERVLELLEQQTENARNLCARADAAGLNVQGCPVSNSP